METPPTTVSYESWEEVFVSSDKGRREVHYYLNKKGGGADLAVIGKEKSLRHISYHYAIRSNRSVLCKLKSRREVIDWLNSIVSDSSPNEPYSPVGDYLDAKGAGELDIETLKDNHLRKLGHFTKQFIWLGSPWTCRKRRKHYQSFSRNGVRISVDDFVYVLAEEDKRLVAYLEDMYEDSRSNKMVVVRWFHRIDEVGIVLPHNFNDREIFFSLCLQDLSIECIDGLATILSPKHYEKFMHEATHTKLQPFVCDKQFDNDDVKPFDITQVKGYRKQELVRYMYNDSTSKYHVCPQQPDDGMKAEGNANDYDSGTRPKKKHRLSKDDDLSLKCSFNKEFLDAVSVDEQHFDSKSGLECLKAAGVCAAVLSQKEGMQSSHQYIKVGSQVEVLSQDSGIRGCWFRALIIKKHKDKVKVRYQDIQDAVDEDDKLEEWILACRVAVPDQLGIRISGRTMIRPPPQSNKGRVQWVVDVGSIVDVWWHDGWWEGIVIQKESEDKVHVYFPGEKQDSIFRCGDLRHSQEWLGNRWIDIKGRADLVSSILSGMNTKPVQVKSYDGNSAKVAISDGRQSRRKDEAGYSDSPLDSGTNKATYLQPVPDLLKDDLLCQLKWKTSKKRRRACGSSVHKLQCSYNKSKSTPEVKKSSKCERFFFPTSLKVDHENCKYMGDSLFSSSVVPPLTSLVMSR